MLVPVKLECQPCLRYKTSPMCPERTLAFVRRGLKNQIRNLARMR
jgi:hypothetical protein